MIRSWPVPVPYFGELWDSPRFDAGGGCRPEPVATPVGDLCLHCGEPIAAGDRGELTPLLSLTGPPELRAVHTECQLLGLIGHDYGVCPCTGDAGTSTRREAALVLLERINAQRARVGWGPM